METKQTDLSSLSDLEIIRDRIQMIIDGKLSPLDFSGDEIVSLKNIISTDIMPEVQSSSPEFSHDKLEHAAKILATTATVAALGGGTAAVVGAFLGSSLGTALPGIGTIVGGAIGAAAGSFFDKKQTGLT